MFNFKPRVYRSAEGCCICKAKSSSSRFTESIKYEEDFAKCFDLKDPRSGQICNACVLLVKRFKRLPAGSQRNWGHVVDARAGPGTKTIMKIKRDKEEKSIVTNISQARQTGKSIISEKFSKIFKKSKKLKLHLSPTRPAQAPLMKQSNSVDSDNEDSSESSQESCKTSSPTIVLFQTQTRASAFRSKHKLGNKPINAAKPKVLMVEKPLTKFTGSKKRKKLKPKKLQQSFEHDEAAFFDDSEWIRRASCCGIFYECAKLNNAIMIDVDKYKVCSHHQQAKKLEIDETQPQLPKADCTIKATLPAVVKLSLPLTALNSNKKSQPVLKKHHLFFKRQSENFPQENQHTTTMTGPILETVKTENVADLATVIAMVENSTNEVQAQNSNATSVTPIITNVPLADGAAATTTPTLNAKSSNFLHKIKADAGKIVKHSFEKLNLAARLKGHDLCEINNLVTTVDKSYVLNMQTTKTSTTVVPNTSVAIIKPTDVSANIAPTTTSTKFSDNSSDSGFDENVQDRKSVSPMQQENETKSTLPPRPVQTLILASGVRVHGQTQNLVYAGNEAASKILQGRVATQNSTALLQHNRRISMQTNNTIDSNATISPAPPLTTLKLLQPSKGNPNCLVSIGAYGGVKMRSLYGNNAIRHENGITTIVPASSLAASNQISNYGNAPNTITITTLAAASSSTAATVAASAPLPSTSSRSLSLTHSSYQQSHSDTLTHLPNRRAI